jgi:2-polyprenyl-3-methyl-5-hydroxy-6-metoxy-1,4-benzoquinol methylase
MVALKEIERGSVSTAEDWYANRLLNIQKRKLKDFLQINRIYALSLRRIKLGKTLEVGCGVGRLLRYLPNSTGIDHNVLSIEYAKKSGCNAFTVEEFESFMKGRPNLEVFDSIIFPHVIEHLNDSDAREIVNKYLPYLKCSGSLVFICPQEAGYASDTTHVKFYDIHDLVHLGETFGFSLSNKFSFPLPRVFGKFLRFNEHVVQMKKSLGKLQYN